MSFFDLATRRCSVRSYNDTPVEKDKLQQILEAGRVAPTAANRQPQRVLVLEGDSLSRLKEAGSVHGAPLALVVCADHTESWKRSYDGKDVADIDATIVTTHMMLQAKDLGLDSIWVCHFDPEAVRRLYHLPDAVEPVSILGVGYADGAVKSPDRHAADRRPLSETVVTDRF